MATRPVVPRATGEGSIGTAAKHWGAGYFDTLPNWQEYLAESTGYGIVSGCTPTISGLTVTVAAGVVHLADGTRKEIPSTNITLDAADTTNRRIDVVYIDSTGTVAKVTGTAAASPVVPTLPSGGISVCNVTVAAGATTGTVTDKRGMLPRFYNTGVVNVKDFGAKGDGVTDDTAAIQNALAAGNFILFETGKTYFVTAELRPHSNSIINFNGATLIYTPANLIDNCIKIVGENIYLLNGSIIPKNVSFNSTLGDGGNFMPIGMGAYGGTEQSDDGRQYDDEASHIVIENMTIYGRFNVESGISIMGNVHDISIKNCSFLAGQTSDERMSCGIMMHWGGDHVSPRDGSQGTTPTFTYHPHNIEITNCHFENIGYLTYTIGNAHAIFMSACYNIKVQNCTFNNVLRCVVAYPGDYGYRHGANDEECIGITVENCYGNNIRGAGVYINGKAKFYEEFEYMPIQVRNCKFVGLGENQLSSGYDRGIEIINTPHDKFGKNPIINAEIEGFYTGVHINEATAEISSCVVHNSRADGVFISDSYGSIVDKCTIYDSHTENNEYPRHCNVDNGHGVIVSRNKIGNFTTAEAIHCIYITGTNGENCIVKDNIVGLTTSAYPTIYTNIVTSGRDMYSTHTIVADNQFADNVATNKVGGDKTFTTDIQNISYGSTYPTTGSWRAGDRVYAIGPKNTGVECVGWVCITSGSPGVWKKFGTLADL